MQTMFRISLPAKAFAELFNLLNVFILLDFGPNTQQKPPCMLFPVFMFLCSLLQFPSSPLITPHPPAFKIPHLYSAVVRQTPPIKLDCSLVGGGVSFPPGPVLSLWSGQFTVPLEFSRSSHLQCVPEFSPPGENRERERERENISDITAADSVGKGGVGRL